MSVLATDNMFWKLSQPYYIVSSSMGEEARHPAFSTQKPRSPARWLAGRAHWELLGQELGRPQAEEPRTPREVLPTLAFLGVTGMNHRN